MTLYALEFKDFQFWSDFKCSTIKDCNDHGLCNSNTRECQCNDNWDSMEDCSGKHEWHFSELIF